MKIMLLALILGYMTSKTGYGLDSDFYKDLYQTQTDLQELNKQEGILRSVLESQVKRIMHKFYNQNMRGEDIAKEFEFFISKKEIGTVDDMIKALQEFLEGIVGSKAAAVILKVLGMADTKAAIEDIYYGYLDMRDPIKCDNGFKRMSGGLAHVTAMVVIAYAMWGNPYLFPLATIGGVVARQSMIIINDVTDLPKLICDFLHKRLVYEFGNSY